jgi:quinoprotein glucose dehydrogenase
VAAAGGDPARGGGAGRAGGAAPAAPAAPQWRSPTQPFPVKPLPLAPNSSPYGTPPLNPPTITPELQAFCDSIQDSSVFETIWRNGGAYGWQGVTYHRDLGLLITNAATPPSPGRCVPPPWMELVAINVNTGDVAWRVPLGEFPDLIAKGIPPTGTPSAGASIATAGNLVFIGGSMDGHFRAFDARNGRELWRDKLPQPAHGTPTTYLGRDGKQYVVIGANGGSYIRSPIGDDVIAYTLP